jgi:dihydrodipicolinate synthase/N-acetylneuraminate lyase
MVLDPALIIENGSDGRPAAKPRLTRQSLRGVWPALLIPWGPDDGIDESCLIDEIDQLADAGVHGTYTGGTAGEFYAQDDATFTKLTELACRRSIDVAIPVQIGCTGLSTRSAQERVRIAVDCGCDAIQFTLPFWLPLDDYEVRQFFFDIATTAREIPLVFYQTPRAKRRIDPPLIGKLVQEIPTLIGMKDTGCDHSALREIVADAPDLAAGAYAVRRQGHV